LRPVGRCELAIMQRSYHSSHLTSVHLNWVFCDWSQPRRTRSCAVNAGPNELAGAAIDHSALISDEMRSDETRWVIVTLLMTAHTLGPTWLSCVCLAMAWASCPSTLYTKTLIVNNQSCYQKLQLHRSVSYTATFKRNCLTSNFTDLTVLDF